MFLQRVHVSRREFLIATGAIGAGTAAVLIVGCSDDGEPDVVLLTYARKRIAGISELIPGQPIDFDYPADGQKNFLLKLGAPAQAGVGTDADIVAFSYSCTHMGCPLVGMYNEEHKILGPCPCHFTTFDLRQNGMVVLGQATQNLPQILLEVENDEIFATGMVGMIYGTANNLRDVPVEAAS